MYQFQCFVVQQDNFYIQLIFGGGGYFLNIYYQVVVVGEVDNFVLWICQCCVDGCWQVEVYGVEVVGGQLLVWMIEWVGLCCLYLVLVNVGSDDCFIIYVGGYGVNQVVMGEWVVFLWDGVGEFVL